MAPHHISHAQARATQKEKQGQPVFSSRSNLPHESQANMRREVDQGVSNGKIRERVKDINALAHGGLQLINEDCRRRVSRSEIKQLVVGQEFQMRMTVRRRTMAFFWVDGAIEIFL
jgi:hypothetical protein